MTTSTQLPLVDESWQRALCIVAHPDDVEFGTAAAIARWTSQGKWIGYVMVTSGEAGIDSMAPEQTRKIREAEQIAAGEIVGVGEVRFLGEPDGVVEYGVRLRGLLAREVRRYRPDIVITNNFRETFGGRSLNQPDHIAVGKATVDAVRDAGNRWIFTDQLTKEGFEPWGGVKAVWAANSPSATHGVDTTDTFHLGVESLRAHQAYIDGLGWENWDPAEFLARGAQAAGAKIGTTYGATFEVFSMAWGD